MRFFVLLLTLIFTLQPLFAQPIPNFKGKRRLLTPPSPSVSASIFQKRAERLQQELIEHLQKEQAERQKWQNALKELSARQDPRNWKEITWQEFLKQNKNAKGVEEVSTHIDIKCTEAYCELLPAPFPQEAVMSTGNSEVDYQTILSGYKLIYVGEDMNHDTQRAPLEMVKILRAAREANPGAKILFATEFLVWPDAHNLPEVKRWLDFYQRHSYTLELDQLQLKIPTPPSLLKKAGEKSDLYFSEEYAPAFQAADELGIDQLALDDDIPGVSRTNEIAAKVGEFIVWAKPQDKIPSWDAIRKRSDSYEDKRYAALQQNLGVSPWGVRERNREWARRIKILQPFYDIIIVYAGSGHLSNTYYMDLQPMVEQKDYLDITLYPMEELPKEDQGYYSQRSNATEKSQITQDVRIWKEKQNAYENLKILEEPKDESLTWGDLQKPFWIWHNTDDSQLEQVMQTWDPKKTQVWEEEISKQNEMFPFAPMTRLEVYLPFE